MKRIEKVTFKDTLWNDLTSFLTGIFYGFVLICTLLLAGYVGFFGGEPPEESPGEILLGLGLISAVAAVIFRFRLARISWMLNHGEVVEANVIRSSVAQQFVYLVLEYTIRGEVIRKRMWLPNTKRPRRLTSKEKVSLVLVPEKLRRGTLRDLYSGD